MERKTTADTLVNMLKERFNLLGMGECTMEVYLSGFIDTMSKDIPGVDEYIWNRINIVQNDINRIKEGVV
jgi:hypothetical protein